MSQLVGAAADTGRDENSRGYLVYAEVIMTSGGEQVASKVVIHHVDILLKSQHEKARRGHQHLSHLGIRTLTRHGCHRRE